jgi:excisionase family DNA binding protein
VAASDEQFLSLEDVAARLQVSDQTVRRWIKSGKLTAYKPGLEYRIREADLEEFLRAREVRPKAPRRSPLEPSLLNGLEEERRSDTIDPDILREYEDITRRYRMAWRTALESLAAPWEERLRSGTFDRSNVEQFFDAIAAISESVSQAIKTSSDEDLLRWKYKALPTSEEDTEEMWASAISPAGASLLALCEEVYAAAAEKFSQSELEVLRHKRDEVGRALRSAA